MPSKKTDILSIRINAFHRMMLRVHPYKENSGVLVRLLLDAFFKDELPLVKMKFMQEVNRKNTNLKLKKGA